MNEEGSAPKRRTRPFWGRFAQTTSGRLCARCVSGRRVTLSTRPLFADLERHAAPLCTTDANAALTAGNKPPRVLSGGREAKMMRGGWSFRAWVGGRARRPEKGRPISSNRLLEAPAPPACAYLDTNSKTWHINKRSRRQRLPSNSSLARLSTNYRTERQLSFFRHSSSPSLSCIRTRDTPIRRPSITNAHAHSIPSPWTR